MDEMFGGSAEIESNIPTAKENGGSESKTDIVKEEMEMEKYSKRTSILEKFQLIILILVATGYCIYGIVKIVQSYEDPATKYAEKTVTKYDYPLVLACMNGTGINESGEAGADYYLAVSSIIAGQTTICSNSDECDALKLNNYTLNKKANRDTFTIYDGTFYYLDNEEIYCFLIMPSSDVTLSGDKSQGIYEITYEVYKTGIFDADTTFGTAVPAFLIKQYQFSMEHQAFHIDQLYTSLEDDWGYSSGELIDSAGLVEVAYEVGNEDYYAPACSRNDLEISLSTTKYYQSSTKNEFDVASFGATIDTLMYDDDGLCNVGLYYYPKSKGKNAKKGIYYLYQYHAEEYLDYDEASLFSGVGGILGTVQNIFGAIMPLILFGISISFLKINYGGYAPYPRFDDKFEYKLSRFMRHYLYQHRASIQGYLKSEK